MNKVGKRLISRIKVERVEGRTKDCYATDHKTAESANSRLWSIAETSPKNGAYDKVEVTITFEDGEVLKTMHYVRHQDIDGGVVSHAIEFLRTFEVGGE